MTTGIIRGRQPPDYRILLIHDGLNTYHSKPGRILDDTGDKTFGPILGTQLGPCFEIIDAGQPSSIAWQWTTYPPSFMTNNRTTFLDPLLEINTDKRIDLAILAFGRTDALSLYPAVPYAALSEHLVNITKYLTDNRVKKVIILGPYFIGHVTWRAGLKSILFNYFHNLVQWPIASYYFSLWARIDWETDMNYTPFFWPHTHQKVWLNSVGHRKLATLLAEFIRQLLHKKPMRWPGAVPFRNDTDDQVQYPPNWWLDE